MEDEILTASEVARLLRRHPKTLERWRDRGYGPLAIPIGRKWMYRRSELNKFLDGLSKQAEQENSKLVSSWRDFFQEAG